MSGQRMTWKARRDALRGIDPPDWVAREEWLAIRAFLLAAVAQVSVVVAAIVLAINVDARALPGVCGGAGLVSIWLWVDAWFSAAIHFNEADYTRRTGKRLGR